MEFKRLLEIVGYAPVFETGLLLGGNFDAPLLRQLASGFGALRSDSRLYSGDDECDDGTVVAIATLACTAEEEYKAL